MSAPRSLPLHVQKAVWGRALVYQVLDLHHVQLEDAGYGVLWAAVRDRLCTSTAWQLEGRTGGSLSSYLNQLGAELRASVSFPDPEAEQACTPLLDEIDRVLAEAGHAHDDLLVTAFTDALEVAADLYSGHGLDVPPQDMVKRVSAAFDHQLMPLQSELPIQLTATTYLNDEPDGPSAHVDVVINADLLDELTVFSLPYVLLHECVCHVLQGPWRPGRVQPDAASRFAEGWMDVVAYVVHQAMDRPGRTETSGPDLLATLRAAAQQEAAEKVHSARHERTRNRAWDRAWAQRAMGARAARNMAALLAKLPETRGSDPTAAFTRLSVQLNTSSFDNQQRDLFITGVHTATLGRRTDPALVTRVRQYLHTQNLDRLVQDILNLFT